MKLWNRRILEPSPGSLRQTGVKTLLVAIALIGTTVSLRTQTTPAPALGIRVSIGRLRSDKGQVVCALFSSAAAFPKNPDKAVATTKSNISHGQAVCEFSGVDPGRYAISVFHDENSNGKLDRNFMGIPREGVGASNNAAGHFGPPRFNDAAFQYPGGELDLPITVAYL